VYWKLSNDYVIDSFGQEIKGRKGFLASWKNLALPKENGGWGLKNPFLFSKALATKNVWRLIQGKGCGYM
jgi:hypothetical protein